jgi:hypothetical protein
MARRRKKKGGNNKQGVASWLTSIIGLAIGLSYPIASALKSGQTMDGFANDMVRGYAGYDMATATFALENAAPAYLPIVGAVVFKKATSELLKRCKVKSIMPSF